MVDYNIGIPQQQLFQAPDFTQNAMRMQQAQLQEMQMQELARKNAAARNTQQLFADPNFRLNDPASVNKLGQAGGVKDATAALVAVRQAQNLERQTASTNASLAQTYQTMGEAAYTNAQNRLAAIPPGDAKSYESWLNVHGPAYKANGVPLPTPEQWAQDPTGKLQGHMVATSQSVRERLAKAPVYRDFAGTTLRVDPDNPDVLIEPSIRRAGDSQPGTGTGPATAAMNPDRLAAMQATQARLGLPPMQPDAGAAGAAVNNMPGAAAAAPVVGNAMAAPSPYGGLVQPQAARAPAVVGSGEFARRAEEVKLQEAVRKVGLETKARKLAEQRVTTAEETRTKDEGKKAFQESLAAILDQYKDLGKQGVLIDKGTSAGQRALTFAAAQAPGVAGVVSPEVGGPMQTIGNLRNTLISALMAATGMSSKMIDSNREMQNYLDAMTSPGQTVKTISDTFNNLSRQYGTGETIKPEDIAPAKSPSGIPAGRKSAAPASNISSMDQQALDWASSNPNDPRATAIKERLGVR
jgi:hypothetical protein